MTFLLSDGNILFSSALVLMLMIAVMEGVLGLIGFGISQILDGISPDIDINADLPDAEAAGGLTRLLGWIRFGQVPALVLLVTLLTCFGITGLVMQLSLTQVIGIALPNWLAWFPALVLALPQVRFIAGLLGKIAMKDETESISRESFIGRTATITVGVASANNPAEAKLTDQFGTTHYLMVEPDGDAQFNQGDKVLLISKSHTTFLAISPKNKHLN